MGLRRRPRRRRFLACSAMLCLRICCPGGHTSLEEPGEDVGGIAENLTLNSLVKKHFLSHEQTREPQSQLRK